jgi:hypothetical protein
MRVATKGMLLSVFVLSLSGAAYAQGRGNGWRGVALVQARVAPKWERRMQTELRSHRLARPEQTRWGNQATCRISR